MRNIWENSKQIKSLRQIKRSDFPRCVECENRGYCTVCMMTNCNENCDGNPFQIDEYHCGVAHLIREKVASYMSEE